MALRSHEPAQFQVSYGVQAFGSSNVFFTKRPIAIASQGFDVKCYSFMFFLGKKVVCQVLVNILVSTSVPCIWISHQRIFVSSYCWMKLLVSKFDLKARLPFISEQSNKS